MHIELKFIFIIRSSKPKLKHFHILTVLLFPIPMLLNEMSQILVPDFLFFYLRRKTSWSGVSGKRQPSPMQRLGEENLYPPTPAFVQTTATDYLLTCKEERV